MDTPSKTVKEVPRSMGKFLIFIGREIIAQRKWALFPLLVLLGAIAVLLLVGDAPTLLPAIYIAF